MDYLKPLFSVLDIGIFICALLLGYVMGRLSAGKPIVGQEYKPKVLTSAPFHDRQMPNMLDQAFDLSEAPERIPTIGVK